MKMGKLLPMLVVMGRNGPGTKLRWRLQEGSSLLDQCAFNQSSRGEQPQSPFRRDLHNLRTGLYDMDVLPP